MSLEVQFKLRFLKSRIRSSATVSCCFFFHGALAPHSGVFST